MAEVAANHVEQSGRVSAASRRRNSTGCFEPYFRVASVISCGMGMPHVRHGCCSRKPSQCVRGRIGGDDPETVDV